PPRGAGPGGRPRSNRQRRHNPTLGFVLTRGGTGFGPSELGSVARNWVRSVGAGFVPRRRPSPAPRGRATPRFGAGRLNWGPSGRLASFRAGPSPRPHLTLSPCHPQAIAGHPPPLRERVSLHSRPPDCQGASPGRRPRRGRRTGEVYSYYRDSAAELPAPRDDPAGHGRTYGTPCDWQPCRIV